MFQYREQGIKDTAMEAITYHINIIRQNTRHSNQLRTRRTGHRQKQQHKHSSGTTLPKQRSRGTWCRQPRAHIRRRQHPHRFITSQRHGSKTHRRRETKRDSKPRDTAKQICLDATRRSAGDSALPVRLVVEYGGEVPDDIDDAEDETVARAEGEV